MGPKPETIHQKPHPQGVLIGGKPDLPARRAQSRDIIQHRQIQTRILSMPVVQKIRGPHRRAAQRGFKSGADVGPPPHDIGPVWGEEPVLQGGGRQAQIRV